MKARVERREAGLGGHHAQLDSARRLKFAFLHGRGHALFHQFARQPRPFRPRPHEHQNPQRQRRA